MDLACDQWVPTGSWGLAGPPLSVDELTRVRRLGVVSQPRVGSMTHSATGDVSSGREHTQVCWGLAGPPLSVDELTRVRRLGVVSQPRVGSLTHSATGDVSSGRVHTQVCWGQAGPPVGSGRPPDEL